MRSALSRLVVVLCVVCGLSGPAAAENAPKAMANALIEALKEDSRTWIFNRLDYDSIGTPVVVDRQGNRTTVRVTYTFSNGKPGWVEGRFIGNKLDCLRFHDYADVCRPAREGPPMPSADSLSWYPMSDVNGQRGCLEEAKGDVTSAVYKDGRRVTRDIQTSDYELYIRNVCRQPATYEILAGPNGLLGGGRMTRITLPGGQMHKWHCYNNIGKNAFGMRISQLAYCSRA
jgi:hypothetical protein